MAKKIEVQAPVTDFEGVRHTDRGDVAFKKGVAKATTAQAKYLIQRGYFCPDLDVSRPEATPSDEEIIQAVNEENAKLTQQVADLMKAIEGRDAKIAELEKKLKGAAK